MMTACDVSKSLQEFKDRSEQDDGLNEEWDDDDEEEQALDPADDKALEEALLGNHESEIETDDKEAER